MLSKSLIQFSVDAWGCIPHLLFTWDQTMVEVMKIMVTSLKGPVNALLHSVSPTLKQATANPYLCQRLLDTHGQVWVSLLWGHCSFLLGPGAHTVLFVPAKSLLPQVLCKFWRHYGGVNGDLLQEGLCHTQVCGTQSPAPAAGHR